MSILDTLITNRVPGAAYGWTDMNRVTEAMEYVASRLNAYGYNVTVDPRRFTREDLPTETVFEEYMAQLQQLRDVITLIITTPPVPGISRSRPYMTVQEANDIEKILVDIDALLSIMATTFIPCGEALCGEDNL